MIHMIFDVISATVILLLLALLACALWNWYKYYVLSKAVMMYFFDQFPEQETLNAWVAWAKTTAIKKFLGTLPPEGLPQPRKAREYIPAQAKRADLYIDARLMAKHLNIAFADITDAVDLETRRSSLRLLREQFGLKE